MGAPTALQLHRAASLVPGVVVLLWSTGFVVARLAAPHADLTLFLSVRLGAAALLLGAFAKVTGASWPTRSRVAYHLAVGGLVNGAYLVAGYWAVAHGLGVAILTLLGAVQPVATAVLSAALGRQPLRTTAVAGLLAAVIGIILVLAPSLGHSGHFAPLPALAAGVFSIAAATAGGLLQERVATQDDLRSAVALQAAGGAAVAAVALTAVGAFRWDGSIPLWGALIWSVVMNSVAAVSLFLWLVRSERAARATTLMLLVPPFAAAEAWLLFGERLVAIQILGFVIALAGVLYARRA